MEKEILLTLDFKITYKCLQISLKIEKNLVAINDNDEVFYFVQYL